MIYLLAQRLPGVHIGTRFWIDKHGGHHMEGKQHRAALIYFYERKKYPGLFIARPDQEHPLKR